MDDDIEDFTPNDEYDEDSFEGEIETICGYCGKGCFSHTDDEAAACLVMIIEEDILYAFLDSV